MPFYTRIPYMYLRLGLSSSKGFDLLNRNSFVSRPMEEQNGSLDLLRMVNGGTRHKSVGRRARLGIKISGDARQCWVPIEEIICACAEHYGCQPWVLRRDHGGDNSTAAVTEERHPVRPDERLTWQKVDGDQHGLLREGSAKVRWTGGIAVARLGDGCRHVAPACHDPEPACPNIGLILSANSGGPSAWG